MVTLKQELDSWLDQVDYTELNSANYVPSQFALTFMNFIKLVNGAQGESHKTPPVHLKMLDKVISGNPYVANLCFRGAAKTTLFMEYFSLFLGMFHYIPDFGPVEGMIYVSDSMDNGVKSARKNIEFRYNNSEFLQKWIPHTKFTDNYIEFTNINGEMLGIKMFGAKALSLDTTLWLADGGTTTIRECLVGDRIMGADGKPTTITRKSRIFNKPMYELKLDDGRVLKVSEDHLNQVWIKDFPSNLAKPPSYTEATLTTSELLALPLYKGVQGSDRPLIWIQNAKVMEYPENTDQLIDPYTVGVLIGDGSMNGKKKGSYPVILTAHEDDWPTYEREIPYTLGKVYRDTRNPSTIARTIQGIVEFVRMHGLDTHGSVKRVPAEYMYASVKQRLAVLQGLMDTDGSCSQDGKSTFSSNSKGLVEDVMWLARSLGGQARWVSTGKTTHFKVAIRINQPLFRLARKLERQRPPRMDKISVSSITRLPDEPSQCIAVDNEERQFLAGPGLVRTHNTGLRGTKIFGKRPVIAVLDDLVSDEDANSRAAMMTIKDTVYKGVNHALDPTRRKVIFNGTPFNKEDILIEAVESGAWDVNVWPVCERFPCEEHEFVGAWEDRFTYEYVKTQYEMAEKTGKLSAFYQELMLRISSEEERLVQDAEIRWYNRVQLLANSGAFNFYITTDFATSKKQTADFSVISVWAYNANGDWFWVDGICERQTMDHTINDLFRLAQLYKPQQVGIEVTGQQGAFIQWLQQEQINRNIWFNFASSEKSGEPGIRPITDKLARFNLVVPWFKAGKMYFPTEMKTTPILGMFMQQIRLATTSGLKGKDDCIDTISMLGFLKPWKPSDSIPVTPQEMSVWEDEQRDDTPSGYASYIV